MNALLTRLSTWDGYDRVNGALEAKGFTLPSRFRVATSTRALCPSASIIERYWNEYAKEYVRSAGRTTIESRNFPLPGTYRSPYLDELADQLTRTGETIERPPFLPLLPCLRALEQARLEPVDPVPEFDHGTNIDPRIAFADEMEIAKQHDCRTKISFSPPRRS